MLQKLTKPINLIYLLATVVIFIVSLVYATDCQFFMNQDSTVPDVILSIRSKVQTSNDFIFYLFVVGIVGYIVMCIFGNNYRKKLFKSNFIVGIVAPAITIIFSIITLILIMNAVSYYGTNAQEIEDFYMLYNTSLDDYKTTGLLVLAAILVIVYIVIVAGYLVYTILKYKQTKDVNSGKVVSENASK